MARRARRGELPGPGRPVVPEVRAHLAFVVEIVAHCGPRLPAILRTVHELAEPTTGRGGVHGLGLGRRPFHVVDLPTRKVGPSTSHSCLLPSDVNTKAPLRVPTNKRTRLNSTPPCGDTNNRWPPFRARAYVTKRGLESPDDRVVVKI